MNAQKNLGQTEIRIAGETCQVPSATISGRTIVVVGKWIRMAAVKDEMVMEGQSVTKPEAFIGQLKESGLRADILTFVQQLPEITPKFSYPFIWDNVAAVHITSFKDWWDHLPQESRKNTRRAAKRGVVVKIVPFDDELVMGVHKIYNETPVRQGRRFWHFGKDFDTVKRELATYLSRSEFIGAYHHDQLIGFLKMVRVNCTGTLFHILTANEHRDKKAMNALIAKALEVCEQRRFSHFIYGQFVYGNKNQSSLAEFKRRNGFERIDFPRYYVPITARGRVCVRLKLYKGLNGLLPEPLLQTVLKCRACWYKVLSADRDATNRKSVADRYCSDRTT